MSKNTGNKELVSKIAALEAELEGAKSIIGDLQQMAFQPRNVIICTERRGVFFGHLAACHLIPGSTLWRVRLTNARQCIYWANTVRGVLGLAATGPDSNCRIGPSIPAMEDVAHSLLDMTDAAVAAWVKAPWSE